MKNQRNTASSKETEKTLETDQYEQEIYEMTDKEFRIVLLKKFRELQENTDRKIRKIINEQHEMFDREIKVNHFKIKILEVKNTISELAHSTTAFNRRLDKAEGRISELEDWTYDSRL